MNPTPARHANVAPRVPVASMQAHETPEQAARRFARSVIALGFVPEALHCYTDADAEGNVVYWKIRAKHPTTGEKWVRYMCFNGSGYELRGPKLPGLKPLYNLHAIAKAPPESLCFVVEGEKAADALTRRAILATTSGGAESAERTDWTPLRGRACVVWADNDEPGRTYAAGVARILRALGCTVRLVDVAALALPEKGDAADWVAANQNATADRVLALPTIAMDDAPESRARSAPSVDVGKPHPSPGNGADAILAGDWSDPKPLPSGLPPVVAFRAELMPEAMRGWIMDIAERTQCPPDFAAVGAMVALGSVLGRRIGIRPKVRDDWQECANLWGAIIGPPSVLKSAALREALAPMRRLEAKAMEAFDAERVGWEAKKAAAGVRRDAAKYEATKRARKGAAFDPAELVANDPGDEPQPRRYIANDATPEALCEVLRANPNGILAHRDELAGLIRQLDREGMEGARTFYLSAYSGSEPYVEDRIGRGTNLRIEAVCVSMLGTIQPAIIGELLSEAIKQGGGDGFLSRFSMLAWPDVSPEWKDVDRWPDSAARNRAFDTFARLDTINPDDLGAMREEGRPPFLRLSEPAREAFAEWRADLERRLRDPDEEHPALIAHLGKYRKLAPSTALICHLADGGVGDVSETALVRALGWTEYLESHARRAYSSVQRMRFDSARALIRRIQRGDVPNPFTKRDVYLKGWAGLATTDIVGKAADLLADFDWLRSETVNTGGCPKVLYWINPKARP